MHELILVLAGGGVVTALLKFIEFLVSHFSKKKERAEDKEENNLEDRMKKHLDQVNSQWKLDYCDINAKAIANLTQEMRDGLEERENKGLERYEEHKQTINELHEAIVALTKTNMQQTEYMEKLGQSLLGLSHDKIIHLGDTYLERGAITLKEKSTIQSIYNPYKKLGGNGDCEVIFNYINKLPIISDEEAKKRDKENK